MFPLIQRRIKISSHVQFRVRTSKKSKSDPETKDIHSITKRAVAVCTTYYPSIFLPRESPFPSHKKITPIYSCPGQSEYHVKHKGKPSPTKNLCIFGKAPNGLWWGRSSQTMWTSCEIHRFTDHKHSTHYPLTH